MREVAVGPPARASPYPSSALVFISTERNRCKAFQSKIRMEQLQEILSPLCACKPLQGESHKLF